MLVVGGFDIFSRVLRRREAGERAHAHRQFVFYPASGHNRPQMVHALRLRNRRAPLLAALSISATMLASCQRMSTLGFDTQSAFGSVSLVDRCVDVMHRAYPNEGLDVSNRRVKVAAGAATTVVITAARRGVPAKGPYAREVRAECLFENGILTSFRWTEGPILPTGVGQAR